LSPRLRDIAARVRGIVVLALVAVLFAALDAVFVFSGAWLGYTGATLPVFLLAGAVLMVVLAALSRFRCVYTGFQDEAVVILAAVAAAYARETGGAPGDREYATMLAMVIAATVVTGAFFLAMGTLRLGRLIRYVPFSVTAGFMISIGSLLITGGIELAESRPLASVAGGLLELSVPWRALLAVVVAVAIGAGGRRARGVTAMPLVFGLALAVFYAVCALAGVESRDLAAGGWLSPAFGAPAHPSGWSLLLHAGVDWGRVLAEWRSFVSIAMISALALLLAVTALELTTRQRVDVDRELRAAGVANLGSAFAGGAAGYHDDAISAMLHKGLGADRYTVLGAAVLCALAAAIDPAWFARVPLPLLGGLLMWLGWQLWRDWLFYSGSYLHRGDWIAVGAIVAVTLASGFIAGVMLGIGVGIALFLVDYSQVSTVRYVVNGREIRSNVDRSAQAEQTLYERGRRIHVVKLQGYLFFARSHQVLVQLEPVLERLDGGEAHYVVIDFHGVAGVDSTATMAFVRLKQMAGEAGASLVFTGLGMEARVDLARVELSDDTIHYFDTLDQGLAWCEDQLLETSSEPAGGLVGAAELFGEIVRLAGPGDEAEPYLREIEVRAGETLIESGSDAADIYLVVSGSLSVQVRGVGEERIVLRGLEPGSVFGEMALYLGGTRSAAVVAETRAVVRALSAGALARLEQENPPLATAVHRMLARLLATKLRQTNTWLTHLR
jgi:SulP family sulfate permease